MRIGETSSLILAAGVPWRANTGTVTLPSTFSALHANVIARAVELNRASQGTFRQGWSCLTDQAVTMLRLLVFT